MDEVDAVRTADCARSCVTLGLGVPDLLDLQQPPVAPTDVVLPELECRSPPRPFEFTSVGLLQDGAVLALAQQTLARRGKGSSDHGVILNDEPCGASVPIACEFHGRRWGQRPKSVCRLWATVDRTLVGVHERPEASPTPGGNVDASDRDDGTVTSEQSPTRRRQRS
jgi:hypothetical protein